MKNAAPFRSIARFVWGYYRRRPGWSAAVLLGLMLQTVCEVAAPYLTGELVDHVSTHAADAESYGAAWRWVVAIGAMGILYWTFQALTHYAYDKKLKFPAMEAVGREAFGRVQDYSADWHANNFSGAVVTNLKRGIMAFERFSDGFYVQFLPLTFLIVGLVATVSLRWPEIGAAFAVICVVYTIVGVALNLRHAAPLSAKAAEHDSLMGAAFADSIGSNATVRACAAEERENAHIAGVLGKWRYWALKSYIVWNAIAWLQSVMMNFVKMALFGMVLWMWHMGRASVGDLAFIIATYSILQAHLRNVGEYVRFVQWAANDLQAVVDYCRTEAEIRDAPGAAALEVQEGRIRFEGVGFAYNRQGRPLFEDFTLEIAPGEKVALVGHSGSGKSSLVKLLLRLHELQEGRIAIDGQDIARVTQASLRRNVALVPQDPALFHRSLAENIAYGAPKASMAQIEAAARKAHAHEFIAELPQGYDTLVGERGVKLSGGERQRVALARAILTDAPIMVLDEATSALDSTSEALIQDALKHIFAGRTVIVIAHRLSTIRQVDRILVMERGRIVEEGSHRALLAREGGAYRGFYDKQAGGFLPD